MSVRQGTVGPGPWPAGRPGYSDAFQHRDELRAVAAPARGQHDRQRLLSLLTAQMQFRGQRAPGTSQRVIGRFDRDTTRRFGLQIPPSTRTSGMLMRPGHCRVDRHVPHDPAGRVRRCLQRGQDPRPRPVTLPPSKQRIHGCPGAVPLRHVTPGRASPDPIDELPFRPGRRTSRTMWRGQQRLQSRPLDVGQVVPPRHRQGVQRSPVVSGFAWSLSRLPETSLFNDHRHARDLT